MVMGATPEVHMTSMGNQDLDSNPFNKVPSLRDILPSQNSNYNGSPMKKILNLDELVSDKTPSHPQVTDHASSKIESEIDLSEDSTPIGYSVETPVDIADQ
jgi:hypothetical protein